MNDLYTGLYVMSGVVIAHLIISLIMEIQIIKKGK